MMAQGPDTKFRINAMFVLGFLIGISLVVTMLHELAGK
jgi:hypothetical protein